MMEAVRSVFSQYVGFSGRARRSEYWWFALAMFIASILLTTIEMMTGIFGLSSILSLAILLPSLAVGARRLHDTGRSGWWLLLGLVPLIGFLVLLFFFVQDSHAGANEYGANPKGA